MLEEQGHLLPHAWVAGDDEMGRNSGFRRDLHERGQRYLLAVPCDTLIRDLDAEPPAYPGRGRVSKTPFQRVDQWRDSLPADAWTRIHVRDGDKGPLEVEVATCRVQTKISRRVMTYEETMVIIRSLDEEGVTKYDFYLSDAPRETPQKEFARVALAAHRVEEAIKRGKGEAGLSHYEVRNWRGWHHHQVLSLMATWFLVRESHRGKNGHRQSPFRRFAMGSPCFCERPTNATRRPKSPKTKRVVCSATKKLGSITTRHVTACLPCG